MSQSQETIVGRPIQWAMRGSFLPLLRRKSSLRGNDDFDFFPSFASAALARSSHSVVLMNELAKCMKQRPSLGSQKRSADRYAVRSLVRPISEKQHNPNKPKSEQNTQRNRHRSKESSVCEKAPCTDLPPDPTLHQISTELRRRTRTSTTHTKHKRSACSRKPN